MMAIHVDQLVMPSMLI